MCERAVDLRLRAGWRFACFSSCRVALSLSARSLSSCLMFGFSSRASFFPAYRVGSRWSSSGPVLVSSRVSRPVRFLLRACFPPRLIRRVRFNRRPLRLVLSTRLVSRPAVPRPDRRSACFARLGCVATSGALASFRPSPRLACRRTGRLAVPWFPIVSGGSLFGAPFLGVVRSSMAGRLAPYPSLRRPCLLSRLGIVRDGGVCRGGVPRCACACLLRPCLLACPVSVRACGRREYLMPACCLPSICVSPRPSYRGAERYFPFQLFFLVLSYSSMMA